MFADTALKLGTEIHSKKVVCAVCNIYIYCIFTWKDRLNVYVYLCVLLILEMEGLSLPAANPKGVLPPPFWMAKTNTYYQA